MSVTLHYSQIKEPDLLDVVDDAWAQDKLPNDGTSQQGYRIVTGQRTC